LYDQGNALQIHLIIGANEEGRRGSRKIEVAVFWAVTLGSDVVGCQHFRGYHYMASQPGR
jgi:hypothetical protein